MAGRDFRIVNMAEGQKVESDKVLKRIGEIGYRDIGVLAKIGLFNTGKACITEGLRVVSGGGMVVNIPVGSLLQRIPSGDILPIISIADQTVTMSAASGVARTDIIECQVKTVIDKNDVAQSVLDSSTGIISLETIKRDVKYYLAVQKKTGSATATTATAGVLTGTIAVAGTIDLSAKYLLNLSDGEDGSFQEIDLRGANPAATTRAEIIAKINAATGRTMASTGAGNVVVLTGNGTGITSYFEVKPPVSNSDADALQTVFGVSAAGAYNYIYQGVNDWVKLCEIDIGTSTTVITAALIRNVDQKSTWASDGDNVLVHDLIYKVGTVSGLDSDKLDGQHITTIKANKTTTLNFNTMTETGIYEINNANWSGWSNYPGQSQTIVATVKGVLSVENSGTFISQTYSCVDKDEIWVRKRNATTWTTWITSALYPVGSFYVQYPDAASNVDATAFPTSARPATMFGGTWVEQFNTEGVVFQTAGYDGAGRTNGLMADQMQGHIHNPVAGSLVTTGGASQYVVGAGSALQASTIGPEATDGTNGTPRTGTKTSHTNRLAKYWKRTVL